MQILTLTILSIILTAPLGAILMALFGPILCRKEEKRKSEGQQQYNLEEELL